MKAIFGFLVLGATAAIVLLRREWAPRVNEAPVEEARDGIAAGRKADA